MPASPIVSLTQSNDRSDYLVDNKEVVGQADSHNCDASLFAQDRTETQKHAERQPGVTFKTCMWNQTL